MRLKIRRIFGGLCLLGAVVIPGVGAAMRAQPVCEPGAPICAGFGIRTSPSVSQTLVVALVALIVGIVLMAPWRLIRKHPPSGPPGPL